MHPGVHGPPQEVRRVHPRRGVPSIQVLHRQRRSRLPRQGLRMSQELLVAFSPAHWHRLSSDRAPGIGLGTNEREPVFSQPSPLLSSPACLTDAASAFRQRQETGGARFRVRRFPRVPLTESRQAWVLYTDASTSRNVSHRAVSTGANEEEINGVETT